MADVMRIEGDIYVAGALRAQTNTPSTSVITDGMVAAAADIAATKLEHQFTIQYAQASTANAAAESRTIHLVHGTAGTVLEFRCGLVTPPDGNRTATFDLKKDGVSILTAAVVLDSTNVAYTPEAGTIGTAAVADTDVLEIVVTVGGDAGTHCLGVYASVVLREDAD